MYCRPHGDEPSSKHRPGKPAKEIFVETEEWNADNIVMGPSRQPL